MACGCKKKTKRIPDPPVTEATYFSTNRAMLPGQEGVIVQARCANCVGLLRTASGQYIPMHTHEFYDVLLTDAKRWMTQGWVIEVKHEA